MKLKFASGKVDIDLVACLMIKMHDRLRKLKVSMDGIVKTGTAITLRVFGKVLQVK
ncbi:hypothetical protein D3C87_1915970 [compost metagenome]